MTPTQFHDDLNYIFNYLRSIGVEEVYLFGSLARKEANKNSDIDIAVRGIKAEDFFHVYGEILCNIAHQIDLADLDLQKELGDKLIRENELTRLSL